MMTDREINKKIAVRLRALRLSKKMTVTDLSKATGLSVMLIARIENAKSQASAAMLAKLANGLGTTCSVIVGETPATEQPTD